MPPIRLLQFTDLHLYGETAGALRGVVTWPALEASVAHAVAHRSPWDALLLTGDLVQDDAAGYERVRELFGDSDVPAYCVPGNHDVLPAMRSALAEPPFQVGGHALIGRWQLVMLDSCLAGSASGRVTAAELERLGATLTDHPDRYALVCLHHHPIPMGSRWLDRVGLENGDELLRVIDRHPQVRVLLWGHVHQAYDGRRGHVRMLATPSTCAQFKPGEDGFALDARPPGYRWLDLHADGRVETGVEWVESAEVRHVPRRASAG
jgi:Icc protein